MRKNGTQNLRESGEIAAAGTAQGGSKTAQNRPLGLYSVAFCQKGLRPLFCFLAFLSPESRLRELSDAPWNSDRLRHELARTRHSPTSQRGELAQSPCNSPMGTLTASLSSQLLRRLELLGRNLIVGVSVPPVLQLSRPSAARGCSAHGAHCLCAADACRHGVSRRCEQWDPHPRCTRRAAREVVGLRHHLCTSSTLEHPRAPSSPLDQ